MSGFELEVGVSRCPGQLELVRHTRLLAFRLQRRRKWIVETHHCSATKWLEADSDLLSRSSYRRLSRSWPTLLVERSSASSKLEMTLGPQRLVRIVSCAALLTPFGQ